MALVWTVLGESERKLRMKLKDTGLTKEELKEKVKEYMIETYERMNHL